MWNDHVIKTLRQKSGGKDYVMVAQESLVGLQIALFAKKSISQQLTDIATSKVKLGFSGKVGNKGACLIRFLYEDTSFCFINCHIDSGTNILEMKKRSQQIGEIFSNAFIKERGTTGLNYSVMNHQVKVILGDMNYRIGLDNFKARKLIQTKDYEELHKYEEFRKF